MFYYLNGKIAQILPNMAVIDIGGVGYACHTTVTTLVGLKTGETAKLYTYNYIREDSFDLYGFATESEKRCFEMLIGISGVGPKAALSILSSSTPESLAMAIITENESALTVAQGIGKKIAQRIILELKDKLRKESPALSGFMPGADNRGGTVTGTKSGDAVSALMVLGYSQSEASNAMRDIDADSLPIEEIIREALKKLMR